MESNKKQEKVTWLINNLPEYNDDRINDLHAQAALDYMKFFECNATELYQLYAESNAYKKLSGIIRQHTLDKVGMYLAAAVKRMEEEALEFSFCHSTSPLHNLASEARFMADREIRRHYKHMLDIINEED